jgi:hypothetical protein
LYANSRDNDNNSEVKEEKKVSEEEEDSAKYEDRYNRPPIMPFEFARDDIPLPPPSTSSNPNPRDIVRANMQRAEEEDYKKQMDKIQEERQKRWDAVDNRSTGYDTPDINDEVEEEPTQEMIDSQPLWMRPSTDDSQAIKVLKEIYIGTPFDSRNRKQARYIVRSITLISFGIGILFTAIWYLSPVKFISFKGEHDASNPAISSSSTVRNYNIDATGSPSLYTNPTKLPNYIDADALLQSEFEQSQGRKYFDDGVDLLNRDNSNINQRIPYAGDEKRQSINGRSIDL